MTVRVALVKSAGRADEFAEAVRGLGAVPVLVSPFRDEPVGGAEWALRAALDRDPAWIAVTSPHAAPALGRFAERLHGKRVAAVGSGTATALQSVGVVPTVVGTAGGFALGRRIASAGLAPGDIVLHVCGEHVRPEIHAAIETAGAELDAVAVYRMVPDPVGARFATGDFAAVIVGSPRLAERALELFAERPPAVAIGRATASALRDLGWPPAAVAAAPTPEDVAAALAPLLPAGEDAPEARA